MANGNRRLPKGWTLATLEEVVSLSDERVNPLEVKDSKYIGLEHIEKDRGRLAGFGYSAEVRSTKNRFYAGDLLYGKLRPYLNKVVVPDFDGVCSTDILVFRKSSLALNKFILYRLLRDDFVRYANQRVSGVQHPRVNFTKVSEFPIPLPPLPEQHRIVAKIEELLTKLDAGVKALQAIKAQLKRYRQSVLKSAFEGKLTAEWREAHKGELEPAAMLLERIKEERKKKLGSKYKELPPVDASELPGLPEGWVWTNTNSICEKITDGTHFTPTYVDQGVPFISVKDIYDHKIHFDACKHIPFAEHATLYKRCNPERMDVLITKSGTIGRTAVVGTRDEFSLFVSVALLKPFKEYILSEFLSLALENYINSIDIQQTIKGGVIKNLHVEDLKEVPIPLPSQREQQEIVLEFDRCLSVADAIEKTVAQSLAHSERLRQSILKRAFEGKLVPQDPSDEPAEKLLERIRRERESNESEPRTRPKIFSLKGKRK